MTIPDDLLGAIVAHARREWPREACGFLLEKGGWWKIIQAENIQDRLHAAQPLRYPRDATEAFMIAPKDMVVLAKALSVGCDLGVIYHSHSRTWKAVFSEEDRRGALAGEPTPQFPEALQLVVSMRADGQWMAKGYLWDGAGFAEAFEAVGLK